MRAKLGLLSVDAEPHCASGVPAVDVLAIGDLCEVRLEWAGVVGARVDVHFDALAGGDADGLVAGLQLVAADITTRYTTDEARAVSVCEQHGYSVGAVYPLSCQFLAWRTALHAGAPLMVGRVSV